MDRTKKVTELSEGMKAICQKVQDTITVEELHSLPLEEQIIITEKYLTPIVLKDVERHKGLTELMITFQDEISDEVFNKLSPTHKMMIASKFVQDNIRDFERLLRD